MPRNEVKISFRKVDSKAQKHRQSAQLAEKTRVPHLKERTMEDLWHEIKPEGWNFLDWHRAWNGGNPSAEHVELYNSLHPDENEQVVMAEDE